MVISCGVVVVGGWPVRLYCHLLGLGVLSIFHFPISILFSDFPFPIPNSQLPIPIPNPSTPSQAQTQAQSQSQSLDNR